MTHPAIAEGNIAVVTGAALGIGRALSKRFAEQGMRVAMLDIDTEQLGNAADMISGETLVISCDVSDMGALNAARDQVAETWGDAPSVLVNNAATRVGKGLWADLDEWRTVLDVNLMGVVHDVRSFCPSMVEAGKPAVIVNVGSKQGITNPPMHPIYNMTKAALKTFTECLEHELRQTEGQPVSAHLLVPGWTTTGLNDHKDGAWLPDQVVDYLLAALERREFYIICPDDEVDEAEDNRRIRWGAGDISERRPPLSRWHPHWKEAFAKFE